MANTSLQPNAGYLQLLRDNPVLTGLAGALVVAGIAGAFGAGLSFTPGPSRLASDNFDRTEAPLSTGWANNPGFVTGMRANGTSAVGGDPVFDTGSVYTGATFPANQYSEVIIGAVAGSPARGGPSVRNSSGVWQGYYLQVNNTNVWSMRKPITALDEIASGTFYKIVEFTDTVRVEAVGGSTTKLRVFLNGVEGTVTSGSLTDTSATTTGNPGVWANRNDTKFLDWFSGSAGTDNPLSLTGYAPSLIQQTNLIQPPAASLVLVGSVSTTFVESGNVNKSTSNGNLTLTGATPGIAQQSTLLTPITGALNLTRSGSITTVTGALTLTGQQQPPPFFGTITTNTGSLTVTGILSSVLTNAQAILTPNTGAAFFGESTQVTTNRGSLVLTGTTPTRIANIFRSTPTGALVGTGGQAALGPIVITTVTPNTGTATLQGQTSILPSVITTPTGSLALTGQTPTVRQALSVTPPAATLTLTGQLAGAFINAFIDPSADLVLTGAAPAIGRSITPTTGTLDLVGTLAERVGNQTFITPTVGALTLTPQTPTVAGPVLTPTRGTALITGLAPTVIATTSAQITPPPAQLLATGLAGSLYQSLVLVPNAGGMLVVGYGPDIGGAIITANTGSVLFQSDSGLVSVDSGSREVTPTVGLLSILGSLGSGSVAGHARVSFIVPLRIRSFKAPSQP